jgi:hypothetical protein
LIIREHKYPPQGRARLVFVPDQEGSDKRVLAVDAVLLSGLDVGWTSVA